MMIMAQAVIIKGWKHEQKMSEGKGGEGLGGREGRGGGVQHEPRRNGLAVQLGVFVLGSRCGALPSRQTAPKFPSQQCP